MRRLEKGKLISVAAEREGADGQAQQLVLVLAQYSADGRLLDVCRTETETEEEKAFHFQTEPTEIQSDTAYVKAFLWEQDALQPLRAIVRLESEKQ